VPDSFVQQSVQQTPELLEVAATMAYDTYRSTLKPDDWPELPPKGLRIAVDETTITATEQDIETTLDMPLDQIVVVVPLNVPGAPDAGLHPDIPTVLLDPAIEVDDDWVPAVVQSQGVDADAYATAVRTQADLVNILQEEHPLQHPPSVPQQAQSYNWVAENMPPSIGAGNYTPPGPSNPHPDTSHSTPPSTHSPPMKPSQRRR
jgi:hypothetical protein